jgi:hypothetical protein
MARCGDANLRSVEVLEKVEDDVGEDEGSDASGDVVEHDARAFGESFELADGPGLGDVEEAEEDEGEKRVLPGGGEGDESDELAGDLVDNDEAGIFTAGLSGDDGGGRDADESDEEGSDGCGDREGGEGRGKGVGGGVPEQDGGDASVGAGAGLEVSSAEEGGKGPGPEGFSCCRHERDFTW